VTDNPHRNFYDLSEHDGQSYPRNLMNLQHAIKVFLCYTAYTISILNPVLSTRGSARFSGGLLVNEECPEDQYDLNHASLFVKVMNAGVQDIYMQSTWL